MKLLPLFLLLPALFAALCAAAPEPGGADQRLASYFRPEPARLEERCLAEVKTLEDWTRRRGEARRQLSDMLGLYPAPEKAPLQAAVTGRLEHPEFTVENVQFQTRPGLYVTGNLYLPKATTPAP